jgi:hypothetical protein
MSTIIIPAALSLPIERKPVQMFTVVYKGRTRHMTRRAYCVRWLAKQIALEVMTPGLEAYEYIDPALFKLIEERLIDTQSVEATEEWALGQVEQGEFWKFVSGSGE